MKKIWEALKKPFAESDVEWRVCRSGITKDRPWVLCLCYVTNRAIMDRLDEVVGPQNWKNEFTQAPEGGILCGISIRIDSNGLNEEWITKWDGADNTDIEATKGGLSGAMKRAAVQWGIGRYLYNLEENFATIESDGKYKAGIKDKTSGVYQNIRWSPPELPEWAIPSKDNTKSIKTQKRSKNTKIQPKKATTAKLDDLPKAPITPSPVNIKTEVDYGVKEKDISIAGMADESLDEILSKPPEAMTKGQTVADKIQKDSLKSQKQMMINKIMKMSEKIDSKEYDLFMTQRIGNRGLVNLSDDELIKFGTDLRELIKEKEYKETH